MKINVLTLMELVDLTLMKRNVLNLIELTDSTFMDDRDLTSAGLSVQISV